MNYNKNNNDNNPWGSGDNNNPWGSNGSGSNRKDFEDSIKKAKDRFGRFKFGGKRNISFFKQSENGIFNKNRNRCE